MLNTNFGNIYITADQKGVTSIDWQETEGAHRTSADNTHAQEAFCALETYFKDKNNFKLPKLNLKGTDFQKRVWIEISKIPFGKTLSYSDLAEKLNTHPRAIARGCASNPIPLLIPCHRVIGKNNHLGGYSGMGGIETKRKLLDFEGLKYSL